MSRTIKGLRLAAVLSFVVVAGSAGCNAIINTDPPGGGVGSTCKSASDCQGEGAACDPNGRCTMSCNAGCPSSTVCSIDSKCRFLQKSSLVYREDPTKTPFGKAHLDAQRAIEGDLKSKGFEFNKAEQNDSPYASVSSTEKLKAAVDDAKKNGIGSLFLTSSSLQSEVNKQAAANTGIFFMQFDSPEGTTANRGSYFGNMHQAYFVAGRIAAAAYLKDKKIVGRFELTAEEDRPCIGFLAPPPSPQYVVAQMNAFALGVKAQITSAAPSGSATKFLGRMALRTQFFNTANPDSSAISAALDALVADGCNVVVNRLNSADATVAIAEKSTDDKPMYPIAIDSPDACANSESQKVKDWCLGVPYWNFEATYRRVAESITRTTWNASKPIIENLSDEEDAMFGFKVNASPRVKALLGSLVDGDKLSSDFRNAAREAVVRVQGDDSSDTTFANTPAADMFWARDFGDRKFTLEAAGPEEIRGEKNVAKARDIYRMCWFHQMFANHAMAKGQTIAKGPSETCMAEFVRVTK
jgi:hypothetical protein